MAIRVHRTAEVSENCEIGVDTTIWHHAQIREGVVIGKECIIGKGVYIDSDVRIGDRVKVQNYVSIFHGVSLENGVFIGPHVCFTNDLQPRAINPDGTLKAADDWALSKTIIKNGAAIGANATIRCGVTVGSWAMIGAGAVVTKNVPNHGLVYGNPAKLHSFVCACGAKLERALLQPEQSGDIVLMRCSQCQAEISIPLSEYDQLVK